MRKLILGLFLAALTLTGVAGCKTHSGSTGCGCGH
jgi:hypothetical protein